MDTPCITHVGRLDDRGYGLRRFEGTRTSAHRVAYCVANGVRLADLKGLTVRHRCDNPPCVNPDHLEVGTHLDNMNDRHERGRTARGERNGNSKVTAEIAARIRSEYPGSTQKEIWTRYGLSRTTIQRILRGTIWTP